MSFKIHFMMFPITDLKDVELSEIWTAATLSFAVPPSTSVRHRFGIAT